MQGAMKSAAKVGGCRADARLLVEVRKVTQPVEDLVAGVRDFDYLNQELVSRVAVQPPYAGRSRVAASMRRRARVARTLLSAADAGG